MYIEAKQQLFGVNQTSPDTRKPTKVKPEEIEFLLRYFPF